VYSVALWWRKTRNIVVFWTSAFCVVGIWQQSENVDHSAQLQTFPYPTTSKLFLYTNALMVKSSAQVLTFKSVKNRQTNKNSTFLVAQAADEIRAPPNLAKR